MKTIQIIGMAILTVSVIGCTGMNRSGSNESAEGTTVDNNVNAEMEQHRTAAGVDTVASPGSNSMDIRNNSTGVSNQGTGNTTGNENITPANSTDKTIDKNMQGQSSTHGRSTQTGEN